MSEAPRMTDDQIKETVRGIVTGRYFTATMCPPDMVPKVFMPIGLGAAADLDWDTVGNIIEDLNKAGERGINDYPVFMSCRIVHKEDWQVIVERATKAAEALDQAVEGTT